MEQFRQRIIRPFLLELCVLQRLESPGRRANFLREFVYGEEGFVVDHEERRALFLLGPVHLVRFECRQELVAVVPLHRFHLIVEIGFVQVLHLQLLEALLVQLEAARTFAHLVEVGVAHLSDQGDDWLRLVSADFHWPVVIYFEYCTGEISL